MKMSLFTLGTTMLLALSLNTFAASVTITGDPVKIDKSGDFYVLPTGSTYTTTSDYYYVIVDGKNRVCYREAQPQTSASADLLDLSLKIGVDTVPVHCYIYP